MAEMCKMKTAGILMMSSFCIWEPHHHLSPDLALAQTLHKGLAKTQPLRGQSSGKDTSNQFETRKTPVININTKKDLIGVGCLV